MAKFKDSTRSEAPVEFKGYAKLVLNVGSPSSPVHHTVLLKKHKPRSADDHSSLFAANLPRDITFENIKDLSMAAISTMPRKFQKLGDTFGLICCLDDTARDKLLEWATKAPRMVDFVAYGPRGETAYNLRNAARFPDERVLEQSINEYMEQYDEQAEEDKAEVARRGELVDEDGFTLVIDHKRKSLTDIPKPVRMVDTKKKYEKTDFYRFQLRDKQREAMNNLLEQYERDKSRVQEMKQKKLLSPYQS